MEITTCHEALKTPSAPRGHRRNVRSGTRRCRNSARTAGRFRMGSIFGLPAWALLVLLFSTPYLFGESIDDRPAKRSGAKADDRTERPADSVRQDDDSVGDRIHREAPVSVGIDTTTNIRISPRGELIDAWIDTPSPVAADDGTAGMIAGGSCTGSEDVSHTDASFEGGEYLLQQGFAEGEMFAATYQVPANHFPITFRQLNFILAQSANVSTLTHYTVFIWYGDPGGATNSVEIARFNSTEDLIPVQMDPGVNGTNVQVVVDAGDTDQIVIDDTLGLGRFSVGVRIDQHNNPWAEPCLPQSVHLQSNAFPVVDTSGLSSLNGNWLYGVECIVQICPVGWSSFGQLTQGVCRPSGDWVIKANYECAFELSVGACCQPDGMCLDDIVNTVCQQFGPDATFYEGQSCDMVDCPDPVGGCCALGTCLTSQTEQECLAFEGTFLGGGSNCAGSPCAAGACCSPDGTCEEVTESECVASGGTFQGANVTCGDADCPQPTGACCFGDICVDDQLQQNCEVSGNWQGAFSLCESVTCNDCLTATIIGSSPADGSVDARQPSAVDDGDERYGLGTGADPILITLDQAGSPECFSVCENVVDLDLGPNTIVQVTDMGGGTYAVELSHPITPGGVTTIAYEGDGSFARFTAHPGNVEATGTVSGESVRAMVDFLDGNATSPHGALSEDIDRNGSTEPEDLLRLIDLLNGGGLYQTWNGTSLPINTECPD